MGTIRGAIFDLDGTLVDSLAHIGAACNHVLSTLNLAPLPVGDYASLAGGGNRFLLQQTLERANASVTDELIEQAVQLKRKYDDTSGTAHMRAFDGALAAVTELYKKDIKLAILSNKVQHLVRASASHCFPDVDFAVVHGAREHVPLKPSPVPARAISTHLNLTPDQCAFIGDTPVDMNTAVNAGMLPIGVAWGFRSREQLLQAGAHVVVDTPAQIVDVIMRHRE